MVIIKFLVLNISLFIILLFLLILFLKYYLNITITNIGFLSFGFKYVSKKINPLIESIKINNIQFQYKRVKYDKGKVFIISIGNIRLKVSPTFVDNISKAEESNFLKRLNKKIIEGIYKYNLQNDLKKSTEAFNEKENDKLNVPIIQIDSISNDKEQNNTVYQMKNDNLNLSIPTINKNTKKMASSNNNLHHSKRPYKSMDILNKISKENKGISTSTLYLAKPVEKVGLLQTLFYMIDNKYVFEIIIPTILSKIAINLIDIKVEVGFPEGSKVVFKQDYISLSSSKKELRVDKNNKYFDYIMFKHYNSYNFKTRFLFSEFNLKFYEENHSFSSSFFSNNGKDFNISDSLNKNGDEDNEGAPVNYKEYDLLKSDVSNSIIFSSIYNCVNTRTNLNFSFRDIKCDSDGWINLIRLYNILKDIYKNYFDVNPKANNEFRNTKKKIKSTMNIFKKYGNAIQNNKNIKYFKSKLRGNPLKKHYVKNSVNESTKLNKKYTSEYSRLINSCSSLKNEASINEFDNSNLNGFMNNEFAQIFFFHLKNARINYHFQILNFQLISISHFCNNMNNFSIDDYKYNPNPQFLNIITIGEISFKGEAFKSKSKLYNAVTSLSLKNIYLDMIDYEEKHIIQFFNIKSIAIKFEAIFQFYKYKQHLSYIKNINFDFLISNIYLTFNFDYANGLFQHINYILKNINNKHHFNNEEDPLYNVNKLISVSRIASLENISKYDINKINYRRSVNKLSTNIKKKKKKTSLNDTVKVISKAYTKFSKLKININFSIKNVALNYIILSEKIQDYYSVNNSILSLSNECILIQFNIKNISMEYSNSKKIKLQSILSSSSTSVNSNNMYNSDPRINNSYIPDDNDKYILYEEQPGLHDILFEIHDISLLASFVNESTIINNSMIMVNEILNLENNQGIKLDKFTTKIVFSILSFNKDEVNTKKEDKFLVGTYFGNLKFNFGSSKLSSDTLVIVTDLLRYKLLQLMEQLFVTSKINHYYTSNSSLDSSSCNSLSSRLYDGSQCQLTKSNLFFSTPEFLNSNKDKELTVDSVEPLNMGTLSSISVNSNYSEDLQDSYDGSLNTIHHGHQTKNLFSHYIFIFDLKINTISFSILNPGDECGFQSDIKRILFHYNNNCYVTSNNGNTNKKFIIKPNKNIKNQFTFNIKEIDLFYLDTIKYFKKGIVMHNFLKINDISIDLVDINATKILNFDEFGSLSSFSNIESLESISEINSVSNSMMNINKISFNIKKIRIYYSLDVFFSLLSTTNFIINKFVKPFINSMEKSISQSIGDIQSKNSNQSLNNKMNRFLQKTSSITSLSDTSKENILNNIKLIIENIQLELDMPDNIKLFIYLKESTISYVDTIKCDVTKLLVLLPYQINKKSNLLKIKNLRVIYTLNLGNKEKNDNKEGAVVINNIMYSKKDELMVSPPVLRVNSDSVIVSIPYLFDLSDVIDSVVHMMKSMKNIFYSVNGKVYIPTPTIIEPDMMIKSSIFIKLVSLQFVENEFESNLSKIFLYGSKEQKERVAREIAFEKKINDLRNLKNKEIKVNAQKEKEDSNALSNTTTYVTATPGLSTAINNNENSNAIDNENNTTSENIEYMNKSHIKSVTSNTEEENTSNINNIESNIISDDENNNNEEENNNNYENNINNYDNNNENNVSSFDSSIVVETNTVGISEEPNINANIENNTNLPLPNTTVDDAAADIPHSVTVTNVNTTTADEENANIEAKITKASLLLKKMNSNQWVNIVKKYKKELKTASSPLMGSITLTNINALVDKPTLLAETSEETIHIIDKNTPADKIYDTLVPIKLILKANSACMTLRDYPEKMALVPELDDGSNKPSMIFTISVFITEQDPNEECKRWVEVKYFHNRRKEKVLRTINPTKMYFHEAKLIIQSNRRSSFAWGYSNDPCFTHIIQTMSAFSKDCYDPSQKLGWWDKMRLNFHGSLDVVITNGGEFDFHLLGSCSPYYTVDSDYFGNDGINIIFSKGINIKLGNTGINNEVLRICCGEVKCVVPRVRKEQFYENYSYDNEKLSDIINSETIVKMSGDVQLSIICTFNPILDNYFTKERNHDDIYLKLPAFATPYPNTTVNIILISIH